MTENREARSKEIGQLYKFYLKNFHGQLRSINIIYILIFFTLGCKKPNSVVLVRPCNEWCDEFNVIWRVDSLIRGDEDLKGKQLYLINGKYDYDEKDSNAVYLLKGVYLGSIITEHYTQCGTVYRFRDSTFLKIKDR